MKKGHKGFLCRGPKRLNIIVMDLLDSFDLPTCSFPAIIKILYACLHLGGAVGGGL